MNDHQPTEPSVDEDKGESMLLREYAGALGVSVRDPLVSLSDGVTAFDGLSSAFLRSQGLLPLPADEATGLVPVVSAVPVRMGGVDALRQFFNAPVELQLAPRRWVEEAIGQIYGQETPSSLGLSPDEMQGDPSGSNDDDLDALKALAEDAPVVRLVQALLLQAIERRASDIHLEITQQHFRVRYRVDGVLWDVENPPRRLYLPAISHLKIRAHMNIAERRLPQDGRMKMDVAGRKIDMRVSTIPTVYGESMVIRLLDQGPGLMTLDALGMDAAAFRALESAILQPHGMILVTGPTGSGKTSTLYAALSRVNRPDNKIITVEDPVEYQIDGINQIQVKSQIDLTFANALRSIVRQDPDIIMVGEIRDRETAEISIQSALTGHLVFSTLHTNDSFGAAHRLMDMGIESYLIASSVVLIVAQRLVRVICPHCKVAAKPSEPDLHFLAEEGVAPSEELSLYHGTGCTHCGHTGYTGRTGIYELLPMTTAIKEAIIKKLPAEGVRRTAEQEGVRSMRADGIRKVLAGSTTLEELARVTRQEIL